MTPHWTARQGELKAWLATSPRILLGCDFDGTLAPVVHHAGEARLPDTARAPLERLRSLPGVTLAVISGRALADVQQRVAIPGILYAGNHGLEMLGPDGAKTLAPGMEEEQIHLRRVLAQLEAPLAQIPGVWIEDKELTASVHYRLAQPDDHRRVEQAVQRALEHTGNLTLRQGKLAWEIRPAGGWHKGAALVWFMEQCGVPGHATAFIGDDVTDLDAFRVITDGWAFHVGDDPPHPARATLHDPDDTAAMLAWMAAERAAARHHGK